MKFRKMFGGMALLGALVISQLAGATDIRDYPRVAVMDFGNKAIMSSGLRKQDMSSAAEYALYQLSASGWFDLIDYESLSTIANMHSINMSGMVDPLTIVEMGKFAGAEYMVVGNVTGLTTKENVLGYQHGNRGGIDNARHKVTANVAIRIVEIKTGRVIVSGLGEGSSSSSYTEVSFKKYRTKKVETEEIADTVTRDIKDEYSKTRNTTNSKSSTSDTTSKNTDTTTRTTESSTSKNSEKNSTSSAKDTETIDKAKSSERTASDSGNSSSATQTTTTKSPSGALNGDLNGDGVVNAADEGILNLILDNKIEEGDYDFTAADYNGDQEINSKDLNQMMLDVKAAGGTIYPALIADSESGETSGSSTKDTSSTSTESGSESSNIVREKTNSSGETDSTTQTNTDTSTSTKGNETTTTNHSSSDSTDSTDESVNQADNVNTIHSSNKSISYETETQDYVIRIGTVEVSDVQVRNAISKAVRDAIYGNMGILTTLNNGKKLKIKTGF